MYATEAIALRVGETLGGLRNATFGTEMLGMPRLCKAKGQTHADLTDPLGYKKAAIFQSPTLFKLKASINVMNPASQESPVTADGLLCNGKRVSV